MSVPTFYCLLFPPEVSVNVSFVCLSHIARIRPLTVKHQIYGIAKFTQDQAHVCRYLAFLTHHYNQSPRDLPINPPVVEIKTWRLPLSCVCFSNSQRTPLSASTENSHIIDYKWDNKGLHHFIGSGVKITCLHLHIMLQFILFVYVSACLTVVLPSSHMSYGSCIDGSPGCFSSHHWCFDLNVSGRRPHA